MLITIDDRPRPSDPMFIALRPEADALESIDRVAWDLRAAYQLNGVPLGRGRFHSTLIPVCRHADFSPQVIAAIDHAAATVTMRPFVAGWDRTMSFRHRGKRPLVLHGDEGVTGIAMLRDELAAALREIGFSCPSKPFNPHITLLYDRVAIDEQFIEEIRWTVREFVLICSLYGRHRHIALAHWPLRSSAVG